jgi:hypothetical protein
VPRWYVKHDSTTVVPNNSVVEADVAKKKIKEELQGL